MKTRRLIAHAWEIPGFLDGTKTQFRRPVKPQPLIVPHVSFFDLSKAPLGQSGDGLWVAEAFTVVFADQADPNETQVLYRASPQYDTCESFDFGWEWTPACRMFRAASRITLEITSVRVERVQDITEEDARAEGCEDPSLEHTEDCANDHCALAGGPEDCCGYLISSKLRFRDHWRYTNGTWDANPWVWVYEVRRVK